MDTKKKWIEPNERDIRRARLKIVGWVTLYLIKTHQQDKIVEIFREKNIFSSHAKYIAGWRQDKANQMFEKEIHDGILNEVDRFLESRK